MKEIKYFSPVISINQSLNHSLGTIDRTWLLFGRRLNRYYSKTVNNLRINDIPNTNSAVV